jgi:hypothetical protein
LRIFLFIIHSNNGQIRRKNGRSANHERKKKSVHVGNIVNSNFSLYTGFRKELAFGGKSDREIQGIEALQGYFVRFLLNMPFSLFSW